jgi:heme/copper-type cytochrome/quinol oxidase subunit 1
LTDTYFVVAHLHYVLVGGAMFPLFGAFCYWYPKATGRMMSEGWGKLSFWLIVGGFNLGFFPMHILGLEGMPRRIYTYGPDMGWGTLNMIATIGSAIAISGGLVFVANAFFSRTRGQPSGPNPWGGSTLEWATASPPTPQSFDHVPVVDSLVPMWTTDEALQVMEGLGVDKREVLVTSVVDATPEYRQKSAGPSLWPLIAALATSVMFVASIFTPWAVAWGSIPIGIALALWFWPNRPRSKTGPLRKRQA